MASVWICVGYRNRGIDLWVWKILTSNDDHWLYSSANIFIVPMNDYLKILCEFIGSRSVVEAGWHPVARVAPRRPNCGKHATVVN